MNENTLKEMKQKCDARHVFLTGMFNAVKKVEHDLVTIGYGTKTLQKPTPLKPQLGYMRYKGKWHIVIASCTKDTDGELSILPYDEAPIDEKIRAYPTLDKLVILCEQTLDLQLTALKALSERQK